MQKKNESGSKEIELNLQMRIGSAGTSTARTSQDDLHRDAAAGGDEEGQQAAGDGRSSRRGERAKGGGDEEDKGEAA